MKVWCLVLLIWGSAVSGLVLQEDVQDEPATEPSSSSSSSSSSSAVDSPSSISSSSSSSSSSVLDSNTPATQAQLPKEPSTTDTYLHDPTINKDLEDSSEFHRSGPTPTPSTTPKARRPTVIRTRPPPPTLASQTPTPPTPTEPPTPVPNLPSTYEILSEVLDSHNDERFFVKERENDGRTTHSLTSDTLNVSCIFSSLNSQGYLVEGVKCKRESGLPRKCFCTSRFCRPYISVGNLLKYLRERNVTYTQERIGGDNSIEVSVWRSDSEGMTVEAVFTKTDKGEFSPLSFNVTGLGRVFRLPGGIITLQYQVRAWALDTDPAHVLAATPPGVFCPASRRKFLPKLANQFSITLETVIENLGTVAYESHYYESEEKLVSFTYRPHLHADGMFLLNIPGLTDMTIETFRVVHDFKTGIQYMINEKTSNCSIQGIPISALDAAPADNQHIRLRHASELISIDPNMFIYKGTRRIRGIISDVWVAEHGTRKGQYSTVEIYFSHENWTIEVEVFNKARQVPLGISSYIADADNPNQWTSVVHTFFYMYSDGHPSWRQFDISPCLNRINRLFLILSLDVSYSELVHYNMEAAKNSIRRALAGIAGVSPLRITDLFLSSRQATGEVDVWFVLLEKPDVTGPVMTPRPQLMMADAYKLIHDITHRHNVSVKLDLSMKKKLFVTIKRGSLQTTTEALHPHMRHRSMRYLKAGYTAGSMAGLGFSMAILGTCVGIFVGFLLWKRHSSVPYQWRPRFFNGGTRTGSKKPIPNGPYFRHDGYTLS